MDLRIRGPVDVNGAKREIAIPMNSGISRLYKNDLVNVSAEEFRRIAVAWDFPLNDEDESIVNPCGNG